jgi:ATP-dependent protease HslVU (ClpYQ) peptidase subunit
MISFSRSSRIAISVALLSLAAAAAEATSIVAIKTGDDIFIGTDSKMLIEKDIAVSQCKISRMNDVYLVFSGIPSLPASKFNAYEIAEKSFAGPGTVSARLDVFDKAVQMKLQKAFEKLRKTNNKLFSRWYTDDVQTRIAMQVLVAAPEKNGTVLEMLEYRIISKKKEPVKLKAIRQNVVTKPGSDQPKILFLGMQDAIHALMKKKDFFSDFDEVRNINEWIMAEAAAEPKLVGAPVDIIKISPLKAEWIQHKGQCPEIEETPTKTTPKI